MATTPVHDISAAREAQRLFFEIGMAQRVRVGKGLGRLGLTFVQAHALRTLEPRHPLPMSTLADLLVCDASNVTGIADRLEARGLIERRTAPGDRRVKTLALTPKGVTLRARALEVMNEPPLPIAALSVADQRALRDILRRAVDSLR